MSNVQEVVDIQVVWVFNSGVALKLICCDWDFKMQFWDQVIGKVIVFYVVNLDIYSIECFDWEGFYLFN